MFTTIDIPTLLTSLGTLVGGGIFGHMLKSNRVKAKADAYKAMAESYEYRLDSNHQTIMMLNNTVKEQGETISRLNHSLDEKTELIRSTNQKVWNAEQEVNRVNNRLVEVTEENGNLRVENEHLKEWRCYRHDCRDDRGRKPKQRNVHAEDGKDLDG